MRADNRADRVDVAVVGGGPAGLTAAIALASAGISTALIAAPERAPDNRTTALLASSVTALETLGVWAHCREQAAPLRVMRIVDGTRRIWRAPEVRFEASEIDLEAFGWNIENRHLVTALDARATELTLRRIDQAAQSIDIDRDHVTVTLGDGRAVTTSLVIGADGRRSLCRTAAGIEIDTHRYAQTALTFSVAHARPHGGISTEFHTETGPFTLVPLPGKRSSLVCVVDPAEADTLGELDDAALNLEIERRSHSILGKVAVEPGRGAFALSVETARRFATNRVALIGEAAHVVPPIGAQGLNLGLRDAASIGELVATAHRAGGDVGSPELLARYDRMRRADVGSRSLAIDLLNRSLLSDFLPVQGARGLGLYLLDRLGPLRRAVMREGIAPHLAQPRLMRGKVL